MTAIYFSGSISGEAGDAAWYAEAVRSLRAAGHHVYADPYLCGDARSGAPAEEIFERDMAWLREVAAQRGVLIADVSVPSLGVGYEIAVARYELKMPVYAVYNSDSPFKLSAMVRGDTAISILEYSVDLQSYIIGQLIETLNIG